MRLQFNQSSAYGIYFTEDRNNITAGAYLEIFKMLELLRNCIVPIKNKQTNKKLQRAKIPLPFTGPDSRVKYSLFKKDIVKII